MSSSLVTFIVPIYNKEQHLRECIDSIAAQTLPDIEILCVDNNSSDGSVAIVEEMMSADPRIRLLHETEQGLPQARNCGMAAATGEYIAFVDADDFVDPRLVELTVDSARRYESDIVLFSFARNFEKDDDFVRASRPVLGANCVKASELIRRGTPFVSPSVCTKLFRAAFLTKHGFRFDGDLRQAEDLLFSYCAILQSDVVSEVKDPALYYYRKIVDNSATSERADASESLKVLAAYDRLEDWMSEHDVLGLCEVAFLQRLLVEIEYTYSWASASSSFKVYFDEFRSRYRSRFLQYANHELSMNDAYREYILPETFGEALFLKAKRLKECERKNAVSSNKKISKIKRSQKRVKKEIEGIKSSWAFRLMSCLARTVRGSTRK